MRNIVIAGVFGLSVLIGFGEAAVAQAPPTPPGQAIPEGTPMPKEDEVLNKDLKLALCKRKAQLAGKDSEVDAQSCKKDLGQETCEKFFDKSACE